MFRSNWRNYKVTHLIIYRRINAKKNVELKRREKTKKITKNIFKNIIAEKTLLNFNHYDFDSFSIKVSDHVSIIKDSFLISVKYINIFRLKSF